MQKIIKSEDIYGIDRGPIFINGASDEIGRAAALLLDDLGFQVFAAVQKKSEADRLTHNASKRLVPVIIDLTSEESISAAVDAVARSIGNAGLFGLVNNSATTAGEPLEYLPLKDFRQQIEENLIAPFNLIQKFLPLIRRAEGRLINISSVGGKVAVPFTGAGSVTKFGIEALSDALRRELTPWKIPVSVIETDLRDLTADKSQAKNPESPVNRWSASAINYYGKAFKSFVAATAKYPDAENSPELVANTVVQALVSSHPRTRYVVGGNARRMALLARLLPDRWLDRVLQRVWGLPRNIDEAQNNLNIDISENGLRTN